jgi:hypothetical protein
MKSFRTISAPHHRRPARPAGTNRIAAEGDFLGHPRGLTFLFTTEMWERFSYYGMCALLVLYMVKYLLLPGHDDVIGLGTVRGSMFGPLGVQPFASQIYGLYTGFVYLTPLLSNDNNRILREDPRGAEGEGGQAIILGPPSASEDRRYALS